jgi:hypothetical protein
MRLKGLNEWGTVNGASTVDLRANFGRFEHERSEIERATLVFAAACMIFASAVIVLMFAAAH